MNNYLIKNIFSGDRRWPDLIHYHIHQTFIMTYDTQRLWVELNLYQHLKEPYTPTVFFPTRTSLQLREEANLLRHLEGTGIPHLYNAITVFQARVRGTMARGRVIPAMLSADPTYLHQSVQHCVNGYK